MNRRLTAIAHLAGEIGRMTVTMGGMLVGATATRDRSPYYEDDF